VLKQDTFNNSVGFEWALWQQKNGAGACAPKTSAFLELFYGPTNATYVERHDRPNVAIQRPSKCRAAAFGLWPFVHRAAFNVAECLLCGRGEQTHPIE